MRFLVVLAFASLALAGSNFVSSSEIAASAEDKSNGYSINLDEDDDDEEWDINISDLFDSKHQRGMIASWQAKRQLKKMVAQMPCGWEKYGIPPLAPFKMSEGNLDFNRGILDTLNKVFLLRVDHLDDMLIESFKVNLFTKKCKFAFLYPKISISADKYETNTTLDALQLLGVYAQYVGNGSLHFDIENLRIAGSMKGKVPLIFGSAKITSLKTEITLEKFTSDITGFAGGEKVKKLINEQIESFVESSINDNTQKISDFIEETVKNEVNPRLKGKDFWTLLSLIFSGNDEDGDPIATDCVPPVDTWEQN